MEKDEESRKIKPVNETKKNKKSLVKNSKNIEALIKKYKITNPKNPSNN